MAEEKKRILIVDDEPDVLMILKTRIASQGFEVVTAEDGQAALGLVKKQPFNVIVTDVLMPNMDGFTFYKELKKNQLTQDTLVLILTARGQMEDSFRVMGADEFLAKPYDEKVLVETIKCLASRDFVAIQSCHDERVLIVGDDEKTAEYCLCIFCFNCVGFFDDCSLFCCAVSPVGPS